MKGHLALLSAPMLTALAACTPVMAKAPVADLAPLDGADYRVDSAADLTVARNGLPMGNDQGLIAKRLAEAHCASRGRSLNPVALGRFQAGAWVFAGGCA